MSANLPLHRRRLLSAAAWIGLGLPQATRARTPPSAWDDWKATYLSPEGRVTDTGQRNISHSEGQGFGMLLATAARDAAAFERMWTWTRQQLAVRNDGLLAWRWEPGRGVTDLNTATDGDLFVAWALQRAAERFNQPAYRTAAVALAQAVRAQLVVEGTPWGVVLKAGVEGFATPQGQVVNLSYWVFPALDALDRIDPHPHWAALTTSGLRLTEVARFGRWGLPPDWLLLVNPLQPDPSRPPRYGYDAARVPLYLHWAGHASAARLEGFNRFWTHFRCDAFLPGWTQLTDNAIDSYGADPGVAAIRTLVSTGKAPTQRLPAAAQSYYSATLGLLVDAAAQEAPAAPTRRTNPSPPPRASRG